MRRGVIDGDQWITERLAFLRDLLRSDPGAEHRVAIEAEIARLSREDGIGHRGPRRRWRIRRWLRSRP